MESPNPIALRPLAAGRRGRASSIAACAAISLTLLTSAAAEAAVTFSRTDHPAPDTNSVAVGDFNQDGDPDLVVANYSSNAVSVLVGQAGGGFAAKVDHPTGMGPLSVAVGDFNQDGDPDLATTNFESNNVSVLLGQAGSGFAPKVDHPAGTNPASVAMGDFNQDGDLDLAIANRGGSNVSVLLGQAGGGFAAKVDHPTGMGPYSVAVGDFNQDGDPDLATANVDTDNVSVLLGQAGGGFAAKVDHPAGNGAIGVGVGDFNLDGDPDLAIANVSDHNLSVLLGQAGGGFAPKVDHLTGTGPIFVAVGDFNQDGDPDLAVANQNSSDVSILLGEAAAGFAAKVDHPVSSDPQSVAVGDFNQDGDPDLAVASDDVSVLLNTSLPALTADPQALAFAAQPVGVSGSAQTVTIANTGDGTLRVTDVLTAGANPDDFVKSSDTCTGERVAPRRACSVGIGFGPTAVGERTATLQISSNAPGSPHELALSGTGLDVDPADFLGRVRLRPPTFAAASTGASALTAARRARVGTRVSFSLDEPATVTFTVERALPGRRAGRRCVRPNRSNRRRRRCTRYARQRGSFALAAIAGANRFRFTGRLRNRKLRPGRYRLTAVTTDAAGNRSQPKRTSFRIVRR